MVGRPLEWRQDDAGIDAGKVEKEARGIGRGHFFEGGEELEGFGGCEGVAIVAEEEDELFDFAGGDAEAADRVDQAKQRRWKREISHRHHRNHPSYSGRRDRERI